MNLVSKLLYDFYPPPPDSLIHLNLLELTETFLFMVVLNLRNMEQFFLSSHQLKGGGSHFGASPLEKFRSYTLNPLKTE